MPFERIRILKTGLELSGIKQEMDQIFSILDRHLKARHSTALKITGLSEFS